MSQKFLPSTLNPEIRIGQVLGDLRVTGWGEARVAIDADPDDLKVDQQENILDLSCMGDCTLHVPQAARIQVESTHGDASLKFLDEPVFIRVVFGSLSLVSVGGADLGSVHGDLSARGVRGDLKADQINGEAYVRNIENQVLLKQVSGNLDLRDAGGDLAANAKGNARLRLSRLSGASYEITASGNMHCHIPEQADVTLDMASKEQVIRIKLPNETKTVRESQSQLVLGSGEKKMNLRAGGVLYLFSQSLDWIETENSADNLMQEDFGEKIAQQVQSQIESQMEAINRQMNEQIAHLSEQVARSSLPPDQVERIVGQARLASERELERSQRKLRRAQEKMERKLEAAQRRQEQAASNRSARAWNINFSARPGAAPTPVETTTDEERLMILRMLEQKKISLEEAERLLAALEGE